MPRRPTAADGTGGWNRGMEPGDGTGGWNRGNGIGEWSRRMEPQMTPGRGGAGFEAADIDYAATFTDEERKLYALPADHIYVVYKV